jgi:lipopolysaccharide transport system ATP-binding protein
VRPGDVSLLGVGKSFRTFRSEWQRVASWFGVPAQPRADHWVLREASLTIGSGEALGVAGPNGAGKSTLAKLVTGIMRPTEGAVRVAGRVAAILELGTGFHPELTGRQNVINAAGLMGHPRNAIMAALPGVEAFADVGEYFDLPIRVCSSGMQMRIAFSVATAFRPDVLIVDEALAVGDAEFKARCYERIAAFRAAGTTLILISHSMEDLVKHCARGILIRAGRIELDATSREVANRYLELTSVRPRTRAPESEVMSTLSTQVEKYHERRGYRRDEHRFGAGGARILDYELDAGGNAYPTIVESGCRVILRMTVAFDRDVRGPVFGFLLKTIDGVFLYGTNSNQGNVGRPLPENVPSGSAVECEFEIPMGLNHGDYLLSLGVSEAHEGGTLNALDRRYDSILVSVHRPPGLWGIVDMGGVFRLRRLDH